MKTLLVDVASALAGRGLHVHARYIRTAAGRLWWDGFRLKIPLLGDALLKAETARFARAMATLVANTRAAGAIDRHRRRHTEQQDASPARWQMSRRA